MNTIVRYSYAALGTMMLMLGVIGFALPVMPGTVFLLVAAWAFARSVPAMHRWLHTHRWFGPPLRRWERERCIDRKTKWLASAMLGVSALAGAATLADRPLVLLAMLATLTAVLVYLHTRTPCRARR
jgi:hypothetical protein